MEKRNPKKQIFCYEDFLADPMTKLSRRKNLAVECGFTPDDKNSKEINKTVIYWQAQVLPNTFNHKTNQE